MKPIVSFYKKSRLFFSLKVYCVYMIKKIIHGCLQIWNFSSRVQLDTKKYNKQQFIFSCFISYLFADLTLEIASWRLEEKFHINANQCIILYLLNETKWLSLSYSLNAKSLNFNEFQCVSVARSLSDWFSSSPAIIDCWPQKRLLMNVKPLNLIINFPAKIT